MGIRWQRKVIRIWLLPEPALDWDKMFLQTYQILQLIVPILVKSVMSLNNEGKRRENVSNVETSNTPPESGSDGKPSHRTKHSILRIHWQLMTHVSNISLVLLMMTNIPTRISNSWQNFKTLVSGLLRKQTRENVFLRVLKWMRFWAIKTQYNCEITTVGPSAIHNRIIN